MKKITLLLIMAFVLHHTHAQFTYKIKADSVLITNDSCTAELNLENSTKNVKGFLYNKGNGRTEFRKVLKLNDSMFVFGGDTLVIGGSAAWSLKGNAGTNPANNFIGTTDYQSFAVRTNDAERLRVDTIGNVGIGIPAPAARLHIAGSNSPLKIDMDWPGKLTVQAHDAFMKFEGNGDHFMHYLVKDSSTGPNAGAGVLMLNNVNSGFQLYMGSTNNYFVPGAALLRSTGSNGLKISSDFGRIHFQLGKVAATGLADTANIKMTIDSFGILIKKADLVTYDTATYQTVVMHKSSGRIYKTDNTNNTATSAAWSLTGNAGTNPANNFIGTNDNQDVVLRTNNIERVRVTTTGKVGINAAHPLYKLDMRGSGDSSYAMIHLSRDTTDNGGYIGISQHPVLLLSADAIPNSFNTNWVAKGTAATMMSIAAGNGANPNVAFFANTGLTPGQSFSPFNMMQLNGGAAFGNMRGVGIGTPVSWHRVHVANSDSNVLGIQNTGVFSATSGAMLRMYNSGTPSAADQRLGALAWGTGASMTSMRTGARIQSFSESA